MLEGPGQQSIVLSPHDHKVETHVCAPPYAIAIEVDPGTHLVAKP